ncbi:MAG TPA: (2Fe-2S)-binding protein, partial [Anaerolineae bacterium]|nr:(2Fe-2S)-binding protein [Anaerolineae bacterium]
MTETSPSSLSRRDFLKLTWAFFGGVVAVETAGVFLAYLQPRLAEGEFGSVITAGLVDDFPANSVTHIPNGRFYIVRIGDGGFLAVYHRCTHLGCTVPWDATA